MAFFAIAPSLVFSFEQMIVTLESEYIILQMTFLVDYHYCKSVILLSSFRLIAAAPAE